MRDIGKNIRRLRTAQNITQDELAEKLFVTRQTVSNYETGRSRPDVDTLVRISEVLEVEVQELLYGPPVPREQIAGKRRLAFAVGGCAVLAVLCEAVGDLYLSVERLHHFWDVLFYLRWMILHPCLFLVAGWAVMQGLSLLPKTKILPQDMKRARKVVTAGLLVYFLMMVIVCVGLLHMDWLHYQYSLLSDPAEGLRTSLSLPVILPCFRFIANHRRILWVVFIPVGMFLWFSAERSPQKQN